MGFLRPESSYYSGRECYKYAEDLIRKGKILLIISPYIDRYYARFIKKNGSGKRIRIIASSIEPGAKKILGGRRPLGLFFSFLLVVVSSNLLLYLLGISTAWIIVLSASLILLATSALLGLKYDIDVKVPQEFVHAKMYISEKAAIHGSVNLTYRGMHRNLEHIEIVRDKAAVERLRAEFERIWQSA